MILKVHIYSSEFMQFVCQQGYSDNNYIKIRIFSTKHHQDNSEIQNFKYKKDFADAKSFFKLIPP